MRNDELKEYLDEKRGQGLDEIGCWQVRIAANMGISRESWISFRFPVCRLQIVSGHTWHCWIRFR